MADVNLLLGLSNVVLIWITIYSAVIELKWRHEDRRAKEVPVKIKEQLVRDMLEKYLGDLKTLENRLETVEKVVENARKT